MLFNIYEKSYILIRMKSVNFLKNLADETRLKILLLLLKEEELCVCEFTQALTLSQPKVSRHIAQLRNDNILQDRREGKWVYYRLSPSLQAWQLAIIDASFVASENELSVCFEKLLSMGQRPQRQQVCCQ